MTTFKFGIALVIALAVSPHASAGEFSEHSNTAPGHASDGRQGRDGSSHGAMPAAPSPEGRMTDAELEENDRRANDPNYEPDPNDPISCGSDCADEPSGNPDSDPDFN